MGGGNGRHSDEIKEMQKKYVAARLAGKNKTDAAAAAGYSDRTKIANIERPGGAVSNLMLEALAKKGITEDYLADEYSQGISQAKKVGAKEKDLNAHAQYLRNLGVLMGYGKQYPQVAVQINNQGPASADELERLNGLAGEMSTLLDLLKTEIGDRQSGPVHDGDSEPQDAPSHPGMDQPGAALQAPGGGGIA